MPTDAPNNPADSSFIPHPSSLDAAPDRKLSHPDSPVTHLKLLWRNDLSEDDRDYWRDRFASATPNHEIRREILAKYQIELRYDTQLVRFRRWADAYEERTEQIQAEAEAVAQATAALQAQNLTAEQYRSTLLNRMSTRALVTGDYKLAAQALKLDSRIERNRQAQRRLDLQERRARALEREEVFPLTPDGHLSPEAIARFQQDMGMPGGW